MLRIYFKYDPKLLTELCHCAKESLEVFFRTVLSLDDGVLGMIMVIHTFGDYSRFHPHLHVIVADGLFRANGTFHCLPKRELKELKEIFCSKVLYRSAMIHGSNKKNFEVFSAEEFIAAITQHIPDKNFQMARYYLQ